MFQHKWSTKLRNESVSNLTKNRSICRKWILGDCNNKKDLVAAILLKREANKDVVFKELDKLKYVSRWIVNSAMPLSDASAGRVFPKNCSCKNSDPNMFCSVIREAKSDNRLDLLEHANKCVIPGEKLSFEVTSKGLKYLEMQATLDGNMRSFFIPQFKLLLSENDQDNSCESRKSESKLS